MALCFESKSNLRGGVMQALLVDRTAPGNLRLGSAPDPLPAANESLIRVVASSINPGDLYLDNAPDGAVPGYDAAGVVVQAAADGSGPAVGTPVVTLGFAGGWAELRAVRTDWIGVAPANADLGALSTVPVAGATALRALHRVGPIIGRRVLVTGATGAVGRYAVQLARLGGAHVTASTSDPDGHGDELRELGAHEVIRSPGQLDQAVAGVIDVVGGETLVQAYDKLAEGGTLVSVGNVASTGERFPALAFSGHDGRNDRSVTSFFLGAHAGLSADLAWLAARVADNTLTPPVARRDSWRDAGTTIQALHEGRVRGKIVLDIGQ
ncbi:zinc-binding dehydrogenase [Micromonospora carbonacea]|uniref:zinc-binding dehydrogenase n=2 Tax=Micromonosporaceae TaxID=28056 RepID=UPI003326C07B